MATEFTTTGARVTIGGAPTQFPVLPNVPTWAQITMTRDEMPHMSVCRLALHLGPMELTNIDVASPNGDRIHFDRVFVKDFLVVGEVRPFLDPATGHIVYFTMHHDDRPPELKPDEPPAPSAVVGGQSCSRP